MNAPSASIRLAPPISPLGKFSSAGWNSSLTVPRNSLRRLASTSAAAIGMKGMGVVPARVHHRHIHPVPYRPGAGGEGQVDLLRHRQHVHIRPQSDGRPRAGAAAPGSLPHPVTATFSFTSCPQCPKVTGNHAGGADFLIAKLGVFMESRVANLSSFARPPGPRHPAARVEDGSWRTPSPSREDRPCRLPGCRTPGSKPPVRRLPGRRDVRSDGEQITRSASPNNPAAQQTQAASRLRLACQILGHHGLGEGGDRHACLLRSPSSGFLRLDLR